MVLAYSPLKQSYMSQLAFDSSHVKWGIWQETSRGILESPLIGTGGGSFPVEISQTERIALSKVPDTPYNDYLMLLSEYGIIGGLLFLLPITWITCRAYRAWQSLPYEVIFEHAEGRFMTMRKMMLAIALSGTLMSAICAAVTFMFYVPGLFCFSVLLFTLLTKVTFSRRVIIPSGLVAMLSYPAICMITIVCIYMYSVPRLESRAIEMNTTEKLDILIKDRGYAPLAASELNQLIAAYETAVLLNPRNLGAYLGLSASYCQLYYTNPSERAVFSTRAVEAAKNALLLSENYWKAWAHLGVAEALSGDLELARDALEKSVALAPLNVNALYYLASFNAGIGDLEAAIKTVEQALEISPDHLPARRLQSKLLIL
jgi:hypothetical protein